MKKICCWLMAIYLLAGAGVSLAAPEEQVSSLVVLGRAPANENAALARKQAVDNALRTAVTQVALQMVDLATLRARMRDLENVILSKAGSFVSTFSPQADSLEGKEALVLVSVEVNRAALDQALAASGLRLAAARLSEALVLVSEESSPGRPPTFWWSGAPQAPSAPPLVARALESLGVKLSETSPLIGQVPPEARMPVINDEQALQLGKLAGAGLVLVGRVRTYPLVTPDGETPTPVAQLELLDVEQNKVLAMEETEGPIYRQTPGPQASLEVARAVEEAVRGILEKVTGGAQPADTTEGGELILTVEGIRSLGDLYQFEQVLESFTAMISESHRKSVGGGRAELALKIKTPASLLADQLLLQQFKGFLINVVEVDPKSMKVVMIPR